MIFHILTIFPEIFSSFVETGILKKAIEKNKIAIHRHDIRDFSDDKNKNIDDYSFGGGSGMIMKPDPIFKGVESIKNNFSGIDSNDVPVILLSPQGKKLDQKLVEELSQKKILHLISFLIQIYLNLQSYILDYLYHLLLFYLAALKTSCLRIYYYLILIFLDY